VAAYLKAKFDILFDFQEVGSSQNLQNLKNA
jgi:hypothetical protein